jgi:hypothetical protein
MPLQSSTVAPDGASAVTGGTAITFKSLGQSVNNNKFYVDEDTSLITRRLMDVTVTPPKVKLDAPGGYTQGRVKLTLKFPKTLANAANTVNTVQISLAYDPETTSSEIDAILESAAQSCYGSAFADLWHDLAVG